MTGTTTIKVPRDLRDRLAAEAVREGVSASTFVARLLDEHQRRLRFADVRAAYAAMADEAGYETELDAWDATLADGLTDQDTV